MAGAGRARTRKRQSLRRASDSNDLHRMQGLPAPFRGASREEPSFRPRLLSQISRYHGCPVGRRGDARDAPGAGGAPPTPGSNRVLGGGSRGALSELGETLSLPRGARGRG